MTETPQPKQTKRAKHGKFGTVRAKILRRAARGTSSRTSRAGSGYYEILKAEWKALNRPERRKASKRIKQHQAQVKAARKR